MGDPEDPAWSRPSREKVGSGRKAGWGRPPAAMGATAQGPRGGATCPCVLTAHFTARGGRVYRLDYTPGVPGL